MLLFLTAYLLTLPALFTIMFIGVLFSMGDMDKWSVFFCLSSATISFFIFNITLSQLVIGAILYFLVGVVWSMWRYKRHAEKTVDVINTATSDYQRKHLLEGLELNRMVNKITGWILSWPFSMIENVIGDVLRLVRNFVTQTLKSVFNKILFSAIRNIVLKNK